MATDESLLSRIRQHYASFVHSGLSIVEFAEQLTYLLFLKIADETYEADLSDAPRRIVPEGLDWQWIRGKRGADLVYAYRTILTELARHPHTMLSTVFFQAQDRIADAAKLSRLIELVDAQTWLTLNVAERGGAFDALLADGAGPGEITATPRSLADGLVEVMRPTPEDVVVDPACGTGSFLIAAGTHVREHFPRMSREQLDWQSAGAVRGVDLVARTARLAALNLMLHGVSDADGPAPIDVRDALAHQPGSQDRATLVLTRPPFGRAFSQGSGAGSYNRPDFRSTTTNRPLNFIQHIMSLLTIDGRAAVVVPDNVLFEGGAGEEIRRRLLTDFDVHTLLRLPTGVFRTGGVKANVLFFDKKNPRPDGTPWTTKMWVYDLRTGNRFNTKAHPMRRADFEDFVTCFSSEDRAKRVESERFRPYAYEELIVRDRVNFDLAWTKGTSQSSLDDAFTIFNQNIASARNLVQAGKNLTSLGRMSFDVGDLYRAAWGNSVSALDHWIHAFIVALVGPLVEGPVDGLPSALANLEIPLRDVTLIHTGSRAISEIIVALVKKRLDYQSLQKPDKIEQAIGYVTDAKIWSKVAHHINRSRALPHNVDSKEVVAELKAIGDRRNQIAHRADLDGDNERIPIEPEAVTEAIDWIERIAGAIDAALRSA